MQKLGERPGSPLIIIDKKEHRVKDLSKVLICACTVTYLFAVSINVYIYTITMLNCDLMIFQTD